MYSFLSPLTSFSDSGFSDNLQNYDLRGRTMFAITNLWNHISSRSMMQRPVTEAKAKELIEEFDKEMVRIYNDFKIGQDYSDLNMVEQWMEDIGKLSHKSLISWQFWLDSSLKNVQEAFGELWEDFFRLEGSGDARSTHRRELYAILKTFNLQVWAALGFEETTAPLPEVGVEE